MNENVGLFDLSVPALLDLNSLTDKKKKVVYTDRPQPLHVIIFLINHFLLYVGGEKWVLFYDEQGESI